MLNSQLGIYRLDLDSGAQEPYASPFPDIPACLFSGNNGSACAPALRNRMPLIINDIAFDGQGSLLVVNHSLSAGRKDPSRFMILKVFVDDMAFPLINPEIP